MKKYIDMASRTINPSAPLIADNNAFYYRNRLIDIAANRYIDEHYGKYIEVKYNHIDPHAVPIKKWINGRVDQKTEATIKRKIKSMIPLNTINLYGVKQ